MNWMQLLRMAKWARHPPSEARVKMVLAIVAVCLSVFAVERWVGWPDWMTVDAVRAPNKVAR